MQSLTQQAVDFGGSNDYSGVSTSRTLLLKELSLLLESVPIEATAQDYRHAIVDENVLLKPSVGTRSKTYSYLRDRFALDPDVGIFRLLRFLWERDREAQPQMALLVACYRDPVLRSTVGLILERKIDEPISSAEFSMVIERAFPERLGGKTLGSAGRNATSSYKQSGHLSKKNPSMRTQVSATPGSTTLALILATLDGAGGVLLLHSPWVCLLDSPPEMILAEARIAASRGWLEFRQAGDVLEISFNRLLATIGVDL